jgi:hypothetical protein
MSIEGGCPGGAVRYRIDRQTPDITVGTLDRPELYPPTREVRVRSGLAWVPPGGQVDEPEDVL